MKHRRASLWTFQVATTAILGTILLGSTLAGSTTDTDLPNGACLVPSGSFPTVQSALDAPGCPTIEVATGDYIESLQINRSAVITGPIDYSARILGDVQIDTESSDEVRFEYLVITVGDPNQPLFSDGFETGNTSLWTSTSP